MTRTTGAPVDHRGTTGAHPTEPNATAAAVLRALRAAPDRPPVHYAAVRGDPGPVIRRRRAAFTVVGAHLGPGDDHETCPVLVYGRGDPAPGPVLLALDDDADAERLIRWAQAEARRRGAPLRIVHVWAEDLPEHGAASRRLASHDRITDADHLLNDLLAEVSAGDSPPPAVERQLVHDRLPARALTGLSAAASLLVVGSGSRPSAVLGDTVAGLLGRTRCPLAVLPHGAGGAGNVSVPGARRVPPGRSSGRHRPDGPFTRG